MMLGLFKVSRVEGAFFLFVFVFVCLFLVLIALEPGF